MKEQEILHRLRQQPVGGADGRPMPGCKNCRTGGAGRLGAFVPRLRHHRTKPEEEHAGSVWEISERDEENLDFYEGYPNYYRKEDLNIELFREGAEPEMVTAMVYIMENDFGHRATEPVLLQSPA